MVIINEPVAELRTTPTFHGAPLVAADRDFETRWAAWVARGLVHERRARRRFVISAGVIAIGAAIAFAFFGR
jgi:hypothetical protein